MLRLPTATEIMIAGQHGIQLRQQDEACLSGRSDREPRRYSGEPSTKCQLAERVVRSLKYRPVTVLKGEGSLRCCNLVRGAYLDADDKQNCFHQQRFSLFEKSSVFEEPVHDLSTV